MMTETGGMYRGVPLGGGQSRERLREIRNDIDLTFALAAIECFDKLYEMALDARISPEARLNAGSLVRVAAAEGDAPTGLDLGRMDRVLAALADPGEAHPLFYCSKLDTMQPSFNRATVPKRDRERG
jgi:hypothetical protein